YRGVEFAWLAETLASASLLGQDSYEEVDRALADAMFDPAFAPGHAYLRLAMMFGDRAAKAVEQAWPRLARPSPATISASELLTLVDGDERAEKLISRALEGPLREQGLRWKDLRRRPLRIVSRDVCNIAQAHLVGLLASDDAEAKLRLRRYFSIRDPDWVVP